MPPHPRFPPRSRALDHGADIAQVDDARLTQRVHRTHLDENVDEGAGFEIRPLKPLVEDVEDCQELLLGGATATPGLGTHSTERPQLFALLQKRQDQGRPSRRSGDRASRGQRRSPLDDLVYADVADTALERTVS